MPEAAHSPRAVRFGAFELDMRSGELRRQGLRIKLQEQPFRVLAVLVERPGELVTREELRARLWPQDTFVDFEHGLSTDINKIREALGDSAQSPRFVETLPRRGYRFIAPVETAWWAAAENETPQQSVHREPETVASAPSPGAVEATPRFPSEEANSAAKTPLQGAEAFQQSPAQKPPQFTTGGFTHRAVAAVVEAAMESHCARLRWRRLGALGLALAVLVIGLGGGVGLNVAGFRDWLLRTARARHGAPLPKIESIAVLPLENLSKDPEQEYFADGLTDTLITDLAKLEGIRVISRTTAMQYKATKKTLPEIAHELDVDAVVEGTVLRSGDRVRVTANLLHAPTDRHLWANTYESEIPDVLVLQGEVARDIAVRVRTNLTPQEQGRLTTSRSINPEAYEAYVRGRFAWDRLTGEGFKKALIYFRQAVAKDPDYAPAYAGLADTYYKLADWGVAPWNEMIPKSKAAALRAIALDENLGEPHASLAIVALSADWDWATAESEFKRSLALSPNYPLAHAWRSVYLVVTGKLAEAVAEARNAQALDPGAQITNVLLAIVYFHAHQYDQCVAQGRRISTLFPELSFGPWFQAECYVQRGMFDEAVREYLNLKALEGIKPGTLAGWQQAFAKSGMRGYWQKELSSMLSAPGGTQASPYDLAVVFVRLGDKDRAFERLESLYKSRDSSMLTIRSDPSLADLHSDPRFQDLVRRMNFPP